jgi:coproporphyrinogen III oxidase
MGKENAPQPHSWMQGRVESIMVSAPPLVAWRYNAVPAEGTPEAV